MSAAAPWSVKGIDPKAREIAKDLARRSGMTLGEWLNSMIMDEPDEDEGVTPLPRRSPIPDPYDRRSRLRRLDDVYGADEDVLHHVSASIEAIGGRLEAAERRSTVAIQGIDQAVAGVVRRLDGQDKAGAAHGRRIDDIAEELREGHKRLRRFEQEAGPKTAEELGRIETSVNVVSSRLYEIEERQKAGVADLRQRMEAIEQLAGPGPGTARMAEVGQRLDQAQAQTSEALKALERSFAALDLRLRDAEGRIEPEHAREAARFEKLAETLTRQVETSRGEMLRRLDTAETEGRLDRIERAVAAIGDQARAAEQRSADAVDAMGREILRIAQNLNGRVETVEKGANLPELDAKLEALNQSLNAKLDRDMGRYAQAVDQRITRSDDQHALALERLGGEITRISDRLSERIAQSERRSAQALDDISRRLSDNADKIEQRHDRTSGELAERMRQSEERTARLLAEARDSMDQRVAGRRRETPLESPDPAPWSPAETVQGDWRAAAFADAGDAWSSDSLRGIEAAPFPAPELDGALLDTLEGDLEIDAAMSVAAPFGSSVKAGASTESEGLIKPSPEAAFTLAASDFGGADVSDALPALVDAPEDEGDGFSGDTDFIDPSALRAGAAAGRAASTRDTLNAARAAMGDPETDEAPRSSFGLKLGRKGGKSKLQERLDKQASREGSTVRKALGASAVAVMVVGGGYATLQLAEGGALALPGLAAPGVPASAAGEPIAAVALTAAPIDAAPSPDVAASEGAALFARASQLLDNGDDSGVEPLKRAAELGHAPAQLRLAGLYQNGEAGFAADPVEARNWARRAAEGGDARAMHYYAMQLYDGEGGARNRTDALAWLTRAAQAGRVDSQYNVARLYEKGDEGVAANRTEAFKWYMIAARRGDQQALTAVQRLTPTTPAETRRAAREAADAFTAPPAA